VTVEQPPQILEVSRGKTISIRNHQYDYVLISTKIFKSFIICIVISKCLFDEAYRRLLQKKILNLLI